MSKPLKWYRINTGCKYESYKRKQASPGDMGGSKNSKGLWPEQTIEKRIKDMLDRMESVYPLEPDIICLPETFQISWVDEMKTLEEIAEDENVPGPVTSRISEMAKRTPACVPVYR